MFPTPAIPRRVAAFTTAVPLPCRAADPRSPACARSLLVIAPPAICSDPEPMSRWPDVALQAYGDNAQNLKNAQPAKPDRPRLCTVTMSGPDAIGAWELLCRRSRASQDPSSQKGQTCALATGVLKHFASR